MKGKIFIALAFIFTLIFSASLNSAEAVTKASFDDTNGFCTVSISDALINKRGYQYATVKLKTYDVLGWSSNGKMDIIMTDENGNHIWSGVKTSGVTLKLGDDHRVYRIYVRAHMDGGDNPNTFQKANNWTNKGGLVTWEFTNAKNCRIS